MAAAKDRELHHFDAEQAFLKADIEEIYIEIPKEFQTFSGAVGRTRPFTGSCSRGGAGTISSVTT